MHHFPKPSGLRTFYDCLTVEFSASQGCGASFDVEVEFTAERDSFDPSCGQGDKGERIIVAVRPYEYRLTATGFRGTKRHYLDTPAWLIDHLKDCIDVDALEADWSDDL